MTHYRWSLGLYGNESLNLGLIQYGTFGEEALVFADYNDSDIPYYFFTSIYLNNIQSDYESLDRELRTKANELLRDLNGVLYLLNLTMNHYKFSGELRQNNNVNLLDINYNYETVVNQLLKLKYKNKKFL